jgi:hypothetical protein
MMRKHARGMWTVRIDGIDHYLGLDRTAAEAQYAQLIAEVAAARADEAEAIAAAHAAAPAGSTRREPTIAQVITAYITQRTAERGRGTARYDRTSLRRLASTFPKLPLSRLSAPLVAAMAADAQQSGLAPRTVSHELTAIKGLMRWAALNYPHIRLAWNRDALPRVRVPRSPRRYQPVAYIAKYILAHEAYDPRIAPWLRLQFLAALRPIETTRIIHGQYEFHRPELGEYVLAIDNKTTGVSAEPLRFVVLSVEAAAALAAATAEPPPWSCPQPGEPASNASGADQVFRRAWRGQHTKSTTLIEALSVRRPRQSGVGPPPGFPRHFLRHSAYQALLDALPEQQSTAKMLAGHVQPGAWSAYADAPWHRWRDQISSALTLTAHESALLADPAFAAVLEKIRAESPVRAKLALGLPASHRGMLKGRRLGPRQRALESPSGDTGSATVDGGR